MASKGQGQGQSQGQIKAKSSISKSSNSNKTVEPPTKNKRTHSEVSNESSFGPVDFAVMQNQLDEMVGTIREMRNQLQDVLKKDDTQTLITNTITSVMTKMEKKMQENLEHLIKLKTQELQDHITSLSFDNKQLQDKLTKKTASMQKQINELQEKLQETSNKADEAAKRSNYNEQYSRKNNIKIMDVPEENNESETSITEKVCGLFQRQGVSLESQEILAIHRIPTRKGGVRPVLIKTTNNNVKSTIMGKRKEMRMAGNRLVDDVTFLNSGLISRLQQHEAIKNSWYFNGNVYGLTHRDERIKFDIYDNISEVITAYRNRISRK